MIRTIKFRTKTSATKKLCTQSYVNVNDEIKDKVYRRLLVGLGNPGKYTNTRHNIGQSIIEYYNTIHMLKSSSSSKRKTTAHSELYMHTRTFNVQNTLDLVDTHSSRRAARTVLEGVPCPSVKVTCLIPTTYMNKSGCAVRNFIGQEKWGVGRRGKHPLDQILIISDDVNLPFGHIRIKPKGGAGGQNGVSDIIKSLGTEKVPRMRIGIGSPNNGASLSNHVLGKFTTLEQKQLQSYLLHYASQLLDVYLHRGLEAASALTNQKINDDDI